MTPVAKPLNSCGRATRRLGMAERAVLALCLVPFLAVVLLVQSAKAVYFVALVGATFSVMACQKIKHKTRRLFLSRF